MCSRRHSACAPGLLPYTATMLFSRRIEHCQVCGTPVEHKVPADDNRERAVCPSCGHIHYVNPLNVVGTLPVWGDQVLLCKRNIEPRKGFRTLPAGFMENAETVADAAVRETLEEANARVELGDMFTLISVPHVNQVHVIYRARLRDLDFSAGDETLEVRLFDEAQIPWQELAFPTIGRTLECYFADRATQHFPVRNEPLAALRAHHKKA